MMMMRNIRIFYLFADISTSSLSSTPHTPNKCLSLSLSHLLTYLLTYFRKSSLKCKMKRSLLCSTSLVIAAIMVATTTTTVMATPAATTPQLGNGYIATFANNSDVFIAGVFNGVESNSQRAPFRATTRVFVEQYAYAPAVNVMSLDMPNGFVSYTVGHGPNTSSLRSRPATAAVTSSTSSDPLLASHTWYAHRTRKHLLVEDIYLETAQYPVVVSFTSFNDDNDASSASNYDDATEIILNYTLQIALPNSSSLQTTFSGKHLPRIQQNDEDNVVFVSVTLYQTRDIEQVAFFGNITVCEVSTIPPPSLTLNAESGSLKVFTTYCTNAPYDDGVSDPTPCPCAIREMESALQGHQFIILEHIEAWNDLWAHQLLVTPRNTTNSSASVVTSYVDEATELQNVIDGSMYGLLSSVRADVPYSTSPGGLSTNGYRGHTFWDMETWMFPNLALFYPDLAEGSAVQYRLNRMQGAMNNAATVVGGAVGSAAFPWESAFSGYDVCPWPQGEHSEIHITADVVLGWRFYYYLTQDADFLEEAFPLLNATAFFWLSRCQKNATTGEWNLNNVTPPDEYHFGNDSVYTNAAVKLAVNFTLEAAERLSMPLPSSYVASLQDLVKNLVILYNSTANYHPEFLGYNGESIVKQADVILLNYPMGYPSVEPSTIVNDLKYYQTRTDPGGPAMTWSMFAVGYLSLPANAMANASEIGYSFFKRGYENNTFAPYYQWYEVAGGSGCPNFLTGAGGFLQSIWAGLLQLRVMRAGVLHVLGSSYLPTFVECVTAQQLMFVGSELTLSVCRNRGGEGNYILSVTLNSQGTFIVSAMQVPLSVGQTMEFEMGFGAVEISGTPL